MTRKTVRYSLIIIAAFLIGIFLYLYYSPTTVNKELDALIYSMESNFEKGTPLTLSGKKVRGFLTRDRFEGVIKVDDAFTYDVQLYDMGGYFQGVIIVESEHALLATRGSVMATRELDYIWLTLKDIEETYSIQEGYIFGPARNKEEANEFVKSKILRNSRTDE